ncbi:hypothetical protein [Streptomyces sp. ME19-01-6]|uniref:hypothetical protein n=1 Tax=Streptomyces sp. ME19-01-6 TaxID=3028686 RepID=UPI0029A54687|nr:hypothetical protein [Streptomyces sp. ME19-01-6]MDX3228316.1 hypothetical protein [Streptomyces sp. ME19-01-6]
MADAAGPASYLSRRVPSGMSEAGADLDGNARAADQALQHYQRFLDSWTQDLRWRIQYIEAMTGGSAFDRTRYTADLPYESVQQAQQQGAAAGTAEGRRLKQLWAQCHNNPTTLPQLAAELAKLGPYRYEPYYAGALLKALGKDAFHQILATHISPSAGMAQANGEGKGLQRLRGEVGPLADLFAAADRGGTLPLSVRKESLQGLQPHELAIFLRLSEGHSDRFALDAARRILDAPLVTFSGRDASDRAASRLILLKELERRPGVVQLFLHSAKDTRALYLPDIVHFGRLGEYQKELANVLRGALANDAGSLASRQQAWTNLIKVGGEPPIRQMMAQSPDLAKALVEGMKPYIPWLSFMAGSNARDLKPEQVARYAPHTPIIPGLDTNPQDFFPDVRDFLAGLISNADGRMALKNAAYQNMDEHRALSPAAIERLRHLSDHDSQSHFWEDMKGAQATETGFVGLLLRAGKVTKINHDAQVDFVNDLLGIGAGYIPGVSNPFAGFGIKYGLNDPQHKLAELLVKDNTSPKLRSELEKTYMEKLRKQLADAHLGYSAGDYENFRDGYIVLSLVALQNDKAKQ